MTIDSLIAEIKSNFSSYNASGLIDEVSIYRWANQALKQFGSNIMTLQETVVEVKNSETILPDNFYSLYIAYKCDKKGYNVKNPKFSDTLQESYMWKEKTERTNSWNSCNPCCSNEEEKIITEKFYFRQAEVDFYYNNPVLLKLGKTMNRNSCHKDCRNKIVKESLYEIIINKRRLSTNFKEGDIYIQYYGLNLDEKGSTVIPETDLGEVEKYVEYFVKRNIFENIIANNDDSNARTLFQFYIQKENEYYLSAMSEVKFSTLTPQSFDRLKKVNRAELLKYEIPFSLY